MTELGRVKALDGLRKLAKVLGEKTMELTVQRSRRM